MLQMEEHLSHKLCTQLLSYNQLKEYFSVLIENNLIEYLDGAQIQDYRNRIELS
jgi:hypothetical protein